MADDEESLVLAWCVVFCALDLHQSQEQFLEVRWTCPPHSTLWLDASEHESRSS